MCPHDKFEIIFYEGGVMLRRCKVCGVVELRSDWIWCTIPEIVAALVTINEKVEGGDN